MDRIEVPEEIVDIVLYYASELFLFPVGTSVQVYSEYT